MYSTNLTAHNTFEFYLPLPNDAQVYRVTYTALNLFEVAQLLNNGINLSHIPDHQFPHHYNIQSLIRQFFESQIYQPNNPQSFSFQSNSQVYPDNNLSNNNNELNTLINDTHTPPPQQNTFEFYLPLPNDMLIYYVTYTELHSFEIAQLLNNNNINQFQIYQNNIQQQQIQQQVQQVQQLPVESQIYQNSFQQRTSSTTSIQLNPDNNENIILSNAENMQIGGNDY